MFRRIEMALSANLIRIAVQVSKYAFGLMVGFVMLLPAAEAQNQPAIQLKNKNSGRCLKVAGGGTAPGTPIVQWDCGGGLDTFITNSVLGGYFTLNPINISGDLLCVGFNSGDDGTPLTVVSCTNADDRQWFRWDGNRKSADGTEWIKIVSKASSKCVDVAAGSKDNSATALLWGCHGADNQLFSPVSTVLRASPSAAPAPPPANLPLPGTALANLAAALLTNSAPINGSQPFLGPGDVLTQNTPFAAPSDALANVTPLNGQSPFTMPIGNNFTMPIGNNLGGYRTMSLGDTDRCVKSGVLTADQAKQPSLLAACQRLQWVLQSYAAAFGRWPERQEQQYWASQPGTDPRVQSFEALINNHRGFIRTYQPERQGTIIRAFQAQLKRVPTPAEMAQWDRTVANTGQTYVEIRSALVRPR